MPATTTSKAPSVPLLDPSGRAAGQVALDAGIFAAELKPHLVHETVRAELNERRAGTRGAKSRGLVSGGRSKPWRQKGTGRARAGSTRASQWTGGGLAFPPGMRRFEVKVNRKAARAALRAALTAHANQGSFAVVDGSAWAEPSTKSAARFIATWGKRLPLVLVVGDDEQALAKSFRNLERVAVVAPSQLGVSTAVWARSLLISQAALEVVRARAGGKDDGKGDSQ